MFRELAKRALIRASRTSVGQAAIHAAVMPHPSVTRFENVDAWPETIEGFEDLAFLFTSSQLDHGIASLALDEAAYLHRVVRRLERATIVEIGRFKGGSTLLIAAAMDPEAELYSYDLHVELPAGFSGEGVDRALGAALRRYGLDARVHLIVGDSRTAEPPPRPCDLVFVDGDHSYAGARADYERWRRFLRTGGHLLFHDAADPRRFGAYSKDVAALAAEIERDDAAAFVRRGGAGSIVHFVRTERPDGFAR